MTHRQPSEHRCSHRGWSSRHAQELAWGGFAQSRLMARHGLHKNVLNQRIWTTREELRLAIVVWIETKCNRRRRQRALGKLTPVEFDDLRSRRSGLRTINPECQPNRGQTHQSPGTSAAPSATRCAVSDSSALWGVVGGGRRRLDVGSERVADTERQNEHAGQCQDEPGDLGGGVYASW